MLCTWARDHRVTGTGVDLSTVFTVKAKARAAELGVTGQVDFVQGDATGYVADEPVDLAACIGATWIGDGMAGTVELLSRSLRPNGLTSWPRRRGPNSAPGPPVSAGTPNRRGRPGLEATPVPALRRSPAPGVQLTRREPQVLRGMSQGESNGAAYRVATSRHPALPLCPST